MSRVRAFPYPIRVGVDICHIPRMARMLPKLPELPSPVPDASTSASHDAATGGQAPADISVHAPKEREAKAMRFIHLVFHPLERIKPRRMLAEYVELLRRLEPGQQQSQQHAVAADALAAKTPATQKTANYAIDEDFEYDNDISDSSFAGGDAGAEGESWHARWQRAKHMQTSLATFLAGRWAAKEAAIKALQGRVTMHDVRVIKNVKGAGPQMAIYYPHPPPPRKAAFYHVRGFRQRSEWSPSSPSSPSSSSSSSSPLSSSSSSSSPSSPPPPSLSSSSSSSSPAPLVSEPAPPVPEPAPPVSEPAPPVSEPAPSASDTIADMTATDAMSAESAAAPAAAAAVADGLVEVAAHDNHPGTEEVAAQEKADEVEPDKEDDAALLSDYGRFFRQAQLSISHDHENAVATVIAFDDTGDDHVKQWRAGVRRLKV